MPPAPTPRLPDLQPLPPEALLNRLVPAGHRLLDHSLPLILLDNIIKLDLEWTLLSLLISECPMVDLFSYPFGWGWLSNLL